MKDEKIIKEVAIGRIARLFELAEKRQEEETEDSQILAKRYVSLARSISTHYKTKMPDRIRNRICKKCNSVLIPGISCRVRIASQGCIVYKCNCGEEKKVFLKKKLSRSKLV